MKRLLHVGCGHQKKSGTTPGFNTDDWHEVRLDIDPSVSPDVTGTMTDMNAVGSGTMQGIFSSHNIEHLYSHEVPVALSEFLRVLSDGGFAVITCPDLQSACAMIAEDKIEEAAYISAAGPITPLDILYGFRPYVVSNMYMSHRCGFTRKTLHATLQAAGFTSVATFASSFSLWALASKSVRTEEEMRELAAQHFPRYEQ
jgi:hypothetical protein